MSDPAWNPNEYGEHEHSGILTDDHSTELCAICGVLLHVHADTRVSRYWRERRGEPIGGTSHES